MAELLIESEKNIIQQTCQKRLAALNHNREQMHDSQAHQADARNGCRWHTGTNLEQMRLYWNSAQCKKIVSRLFFLLYEISRLKNDSN